jgi:riboflavin synthase
MFTGLVQAVGEITESRSTEHDRIFRIRSELSARDLALGASVAIDGVCLTVIAAERDWFEVQAAFETLSCKTLAALDAGARVNLEPSLRVGDPLGGHFVLGHVDGIGSVRSVVARGDAREVWCDPSPSLMPYLAVKGSVALAGVSLTINAVDERGFMVGLIPHTLSATTLGELRPQAHVNLEADVLARYVARRLGGLDGWNARFDRDPESQRTQPWSFPPVPFSDEEGT